MPWKQLCNTHMVIFLPYECYKVTSMLPSFQFIFITRANKLLVTKIFKWRMPRRMPAKLYTFFRYKASRVKIVCVYFLCVFQKVVFSLHVKKSMLFFCICVILLVNISIVVTFLMVDSKLVRFSVEWNSQYDIFWCWILGVIVNLSW